LYSGGEPLLQKDHYRSLEALLPQSKKVTLEYTSNLNYLNFERYDVLELWKQFKHIYVKVSLDADEFLYPYVRRKGKIEAVKRNIQKIHENLDPMRLTLVGTCTTSVYNVGRLPEIMQFFNELGMYTHTSIVEYPTFLSPQVLPKLIKQSVNHKIAAFLADLEDRPMVQPMGVKRFNQEKQRLRTLKWVRNCQQFLLGSDQSSEWPQFLKYNSFFDRGNKGLREIYPEWEPFL
jgi:sulfatase maturation enzyme AslB (radical SAM superfamily)